MTMTGPGEIFLLLLVVTGGGPLDGGSERFHGAALKGQSRESNEHKLEVAFINKCIVLNSLFTLSLLLMMWEQTSEKPVLFVLKK